MHASLGKIAAMFGLLTGLAGSSAPFQTVTGNQTVEDWTGRIDQRIQAWQPTKDEHFLDQIGWAKDIRDALRLAKEHQRPIFLFTYSGSPTRERAIALQRC